MGLGLHDGRWCGCAVVRERDGNVPASERGQRRRQNLGFPESTLRVRPATHGPATRRRIRGHTRQTHTPMYCVGHARKSRATVRTYGVRKELAGELNFRVMRWLNKILTVDVTVSVSSPSTH
eukprot:606765-Prorocentrum_minimum.AAC.1